MTWIDYRGYKIKLNRTFENAEERIARGDYKSRVIGHYFHIWKPAEVGEAFQRIREIPEIDYFTADAAIATAKTTIDSMLHGGHHTASVTSTQESGERSVNRA